MNQSSARLMKENHPLPRSASRIEAQESLEKGVKPYLTIS
jgi:hypothetical protein